MPQSGWLCRRSRQSRNRLLHQLQGIASGITLTNSHQLGEYSSGQRGQIVNLLATPSKVRILLRPFRFIPWLAQCFRVGMVI